jgi:demethylmenaquinone methyltransferase/2-methoxy-6-polyprenyl-1,4-benzoquinol methylase
MALTTAGIRDVYESRSRYYDRILSAYLIVGLRAEHYRRRAVSALSLTRGGTVVDLGCGTGLNFPLLEDAVGPTGQIIGVDTTPSMLERASARVRAFGWHNVDLVQADIAEYAFPVDISGVLSTFAITLTPAYDEVIRRAASALLPKGRMAILDLKKPDCWPEWLVRFGAWLNKPFGVSLDLSDRHPWESLRQSLSEVSFVEWYFGAGYLAVGEAMQCLHLISRVAEPTISLSDRKVSPSR